MTAGKETMGEQPIFTCKAHVFHIDPKTKRSWMSASSAAVSVSFFYDSSRNLYRIISVEGTKAVINSTITANMTFTKTSQKFGQWSDVRANTVYGLGFASEAELGKFIEKFQEVKEAIQAQQCGAGKPPPNGSSGAATPVASATASPLLAGRAPPDEPPAVSPAQPKTENDEMMVHQRAHSVSSTLQRQDNLENDARSISDASRKTSDRKSQLSRSDTSKRRPVRKRRKHFGGARVDPSESFGVYVATKHRGYGDRVRSVVEMMISRVLFSADMGKYNDYQPRDLLERSVSDLDELKPDLETSTLLSRAYSSD
ncbi:unnamed protein product, partial [Iphiclides podalirius]